MASTDPKRAERVYGARISKENGYDADSYTYYPVAIIGAGESGIAMGCRLKEKFGFDQFRLFDRQSGIGGTWWINRYPGVACDIPAAFYSFSFALNKKWSALYPPGPEIVKYLQGVCEKYEIVDKIQLNTDVTSCRWNDSEGVWELTTHELVKGVGDLSSYDRVAMIKNQGEDSVFVRSEKIRAKVLISAVGGLVEPNRMPETIPGVEDFQGPIFHSARWRYDVDLKDKDIIVVGTGCSAAQFVPQLTTTYGAKSVTQLMRSPPWVFPKQMPPFGLGDEEWAEWSPWLNTYIPGFAKFQRLLIASLAEYNWRWFGDSKYAENERAKLEVALLQYMKSRVPEKYHEILSPKYGVCCKRLVIDGGWFKSLHDEKVVLSTLPLTHIHKDRVTLGDRNVAADVIILANGFETLDWLHPLEVIGRSGKKLDEVFSERGGPQLYMGSAMDGFPNFFAIFGPNTVTGHSSVVLATENMVNYAMKMIEPILKGDAHYVEVKKEAEMAWTADIQKSLKKRVWSTGGCKSWYQGEDGWNSTTYPYSQVWFSLLCMFPKYRDWNYKYTTKGFAKTLAKRILRIIALAGIATGLYFARQAGSNFSWKEGVAVARLARRQLLNKLGESLKVQKIPKKTKERMVGVSLCTTYKNVTLFMQRHGLRSCAKASFPLTPNHRTETALWTGPHDMRTIRSTGGSLSRYSNGIFMKSLCCKFALGPLLRRHITTIQSNIADVPIGDFQAKAFVPQTPILIQRPETDDSAKIAAEAGIPAIDRWFKSIETRVGDDVVFFQEEYLKPFVSTMLPYELVTPVFNSQNGQDVLSKFISENTSPWSGCLPTNDLSIKELLRECALADIYDASERDGSRLTEADTTSASGANLDGPLTERQVELLRRHAQLFQKFHSFHAPLELIITASRQQSGSAQFGLPGLYIAQAQMVDLPQQLRDDLPTPELVSKAGKGDVYDANIWIGTPPTFTPLHKDPNPNLFVQLSSSKKVRVFEPRQGQAIFAAVRRKIGASPTAAFRGEEMMQGRERVELKEAVWNHANSDGHEVTVRPGDALFIPKGWWHSIKSEGDGLNASANWWFR
ncbi:hypothetical protein V494_07744 [Pseudogymnoascus sp. VKM F-4513 (FW-928)]|nr:hypothetical protein V494_07744 [Pseudogymnoascus sp. VKM F-4513 (FW-928)]